MQIAQQKTLNRLTYFMTFPYTELLRVLLATIPPVTDAWLEDNGLKRQDELFNFAGRKFLKLFDPCLEFIN